MLMSRYTGLSIEDEDHLRQSIIDILTTPIGSRVIVRDYGCGLCELIDKPINRTWVVGCYSVIASALARWEPRFTLMLQGIDGSAISTGQLNLWVEGLYKPLGRVIRLENIVLQFVNA